MKGKTAVGCTNYKECGFKLPFILMGKKLTENQLSDIIVKGKSGNIKGLLNGNQENKEGKFILGEDFNVEFEAKL